jgi:hypothetical protein
MTTKTLRLIIQVDPNETIYLLDGIGKRDGARLAENGWMWTGGPNGGCWNTTDALEAEKFASLPTFSANTGQPCTFYGPQEPPQVGIIYNTRQADGNFRPLAPFFDGRK